MNPPDLANSQKVSPLVDRGGSPLHNAVSGLNPPEHGNIKVRKGERVQNLLEGHLAQSPPCQGKCQGCCPHPRQVLGFYIVFCCILGELSVFCEDLQIRLTFRCPECFAKVCKAQLFHLNRQTFHENDVLGGNVIRPLFLFGKCGLRIYLLIQESEK